MADVEDNLPLPKLSLSRLGFVGGTVAYVAALFLSYVSLIAPAFGYLGAVYHPQGVAPLVVAVVCAVLPTLWIPVWLERPSQVMYVLLYFIVMIPTLLVGAATGMFTLSRVLLFGGVFLLVFGALRLVYELPLAEVSKLIETQVGFWVALTIVGGVLYGILFLRYGLYTDLPSLAEVYAQRAEFRQAVSGLGAYAFFWLAKAVNPFLLAKGYVDRNPYLFVAGFSGQLVLFAMSGLRSVLFSFLLLGGILLALSWDGRYFSNWIVWGLLSLIGASAAADAILGFNLSTSLFVRRLLVVPGLNTTLYLDFFSTNPHVYLGHSVLDWVVDYPYEARPAMVIGNAYFGHVDGPIDMSANASLWADAYANFGILGILFFTGLLGAVFWVADSLALGSSWKLSVLMLSYPAYMLVNTKLQTTLLTHGLLLVLVLLYLLPRQQDASDNG